MAFEPEGRHVEEDGALRIGGIEGCEDVCGTWGVECCVVGAVDLYCVVCGVVEEGGIPGDCQELSICTE